MQQHSGQHVLSAAFVRLFDVRTVSFHLGGEASTIDLAREMTPRELAAAEDEANRIIWEDRPVTIRFVSAEEAAALPLRKEPVRSGTLRLIDVEDFDLSACGGTHVARTGQIGLIAITAWERFKGGQRLEFHCGHRALAKLRSLRDTAVAGARLLSVPGGELPEAIERLQAEAKEHRRGLAALQSELARYQADELAAAAETTPRGRFVFKAVDADANPLKALATAIVSRGGLGAVLVSTARPALVVISRAPDVAAASHEILARLTSKFGGRGGGKADLAQAGGVDAPAEAILAEAREIVR
jgi:alanyl-tRNA synthetase